MALFSAVGRIASTLVAMVGTRLELAAVEFQEDTRRLLGYLAWSLLAVFLAAGGTMLVALFVILLFWDSYRLQAVAGMAVLLAAGAGVIVMSVRSRFKAQAPLFSDTLAELRKDVEYVRHTAAAAHAGAIDE